MKNMKKWIISLFVIISVLTMNIELVFAISEHKQDVTVGNVDLPIYSVDISWGSMKFVYNKKDVYTWSDTTHEYSKSTKYSWDATGNNIDIYNKSSFDIEVSCNYVKTNNSLNGSFTMTNYSVKSKEKSRNYFELKGNLSSSVSTYQKVGTISLKIS